MGTIPSNMPHGKVAQTVSPHSSTRRRLHSDDPSLGKLAGAVFVLLLLIGGAIALYGLGQKNATEYDKSSLCPTNRKVSGLTVILLDMSDTLTEAQRVAIKNEVTREANRTPQFGRIEVYAVGSTADQLIRPVIALCNPGSDESVNRLYQNPELVKRRWQQFLASLVNQVEQLMHTPDTEQSPILEAVQALALRSFNRPEFDGLPKRLVVVSDLLQNVPGRLSFYSDVPDPSEFLKSPYYASVHAELMGVETRLLVILRKQTSAPSAWRKLRDFWTYVLQREGASVIEVAPI